MLSAGAQGTALPFVVRGARLLESMEIMTGEALKAARLALGLSQDEFAQLVRVAWRCRCHMPDMRKKPRCGC